jgi:hypothetical protein
MSILQRLKSRISIETVAVTLVIGFGLLLRLRQYTLNLSFWLDEAMLALNIVQRTFGELIKPLDYDQGAPLGFLWTIKAAETLLGNRELSLRLFPFLMGCLSLIVLWLVSRQLIKPLGGIFALLIFASSRYLVSYSTQVKQYAVDATVALLLYLLGLSLLCKTATKRDYFLLALLGGLSIWMSHPAVFTLGGLGLTLIVTAALKKDWKGTLGYGLASAFWALNFVALYLIQYSSLAANAYLTDFWAEYFMPLTISAPGWALDRLGGLFYIPGGLSVEVPSALILILFLAGVVSLFQRGQRWVWMFVLSLVFTLAASSLGKYPFGGRMGMFAMPGLLICVGEGIELVRRLFTRRLSGSVKMNNPSSSTTAGQTGIEQPKAGQQEQQPFALGPTLGFVAAVLLAGYLAYSPLSFAVETALKPKMTENIAPTMAYLKANYREGDVIYLYHWSIPAFRYYAPKYGLDQARVVEGSDFHIVPEVYCDEVQRLLGNKRAWFLFSHLTDASYLDERETILDCAGKIGARKREFSEPGTLINLFLYDLHQLVF